MTLLSSVLDPETDEARRWLQNELARGEYNRPESVVERVVTWLGERLAFTVNLIPGVGGLGSVIILLVVVAAVVGAVLMIRGRWRRRALTARDTGAVLDDPSLTPADYRARASSAFSSGQWDAALLDYYRAIASEAVQRTVLDERPGRTAHEVALELRDAFPDQHAELLQAAADFDDVRYGQGHTTRDRAQAVRDLDRSLRRARPQHRELVGGSW